MPFPAVASIQKSRFRQRELRSYCADSQWPPIDLRNCGRELFWQNRWLRAAYHCLEKLRRLEPFNVCRHSPLPQTVSGLTVIGQFFSQNARHAAGRYHNETKARSFRAFHDHLSYSSGRMDPIDPDANCFLYHPARYAGIANPTRPANSDPIGGPSGRPRSQPQQRHY